MLLYKYLPADRVDVLENLKIRFTQSASLNDPFELKPFFYKLLSKDSHKESLESGLRRAYVETGSDKLMTYSKFYSLVKHRVPGVEKDFEKIGKEKLKQAMDFMRDSVGILSLSENNDDLLMWSHYAGSHSGYVIAFDVDHPFFAEFNGKEERQYFDLGKVEYNQKRLHLTIDQLKGSKVLFWKPECWAYEKEWRFIKNFEGRPDFVIDGDEVFLFDLPPECIKSVYLGANMKADSIEKIQSLLAEKNRSHIAINQMKLCEEEFALKVEALS